MSASTYVARPVEIEAIQWTGDNTQEVREFAGDAFMRLMGRDSSREIQIAVRGTANQYVPGRLGDYVVRGTEGEIYLCPQSVFEAKYEPRDGYLDAGGPPADHGGPGEDAWAERP